MSSHNIKLANELFKKLIKRKNKGKYSKIVKKIW